MNIAQVAGGGLGIVVSLSACFVCYEMSIAYWFPVRAGTRWRRFVEAPKLRTFAPTFRWFMPLFVIVTAVQAATAVRVLVAGLSHG
jgi:hypothetical protein